jgi:hypothetical protein
MADISVMNVGGTDYNIKDSTSRTNSTKAMSLSAYYETGNTASQAYSIVGTPINWKGTLYYTKTTVAKGATWTVGTNLTAATNLGKLVRNIKTYVGSDSKLHFVDLTGADTALNFSASKVYKVASVTNYQETTIDISAKVPNYKNLTANNIILGNVHIYMGGSTYYVNSVDIKPTYVASTGIITIPARLIGNNGATAACDTLDVFVVDGTILDVS